MCGWLQIGTAQVDDKRVSVAIGLAWILLPLSLRVSAIRSLRRAGRPVERPWTFVLRAPMIWVGAVLVLLAVNQAAGTIAATIGMVALLAFAARMLINGPNTMRRAFRRIGDPDAWRGLPSRADHEESRPFGALLWHKVALGAVALLSLILLATVLGSR